MVQNCILINSIQSCVVFKVKNDNNEIGWRTQQTNYLTQIQILKNRTKKFVSILIIFLIRVQSFEKALWKKKKKKK